MQRWSPRPKGRPASTSARSAAIWTTKEERKTSSQLTTQPNPLVSKLDVATTNGVKHVQRPDRREDPSGCSRTASTGASSTRIRLRWYSELVVNAADVQFAVNYQTWTSVLTGY